ncbi:xanthine dehydrogenase family protein molybdopterin-binding subunit [Rhizobium sp. BK176]|uniref:xanthine dehydrogenase family protein molybdopterin-binding subunit n=1 Tax=Rhizobium sp. BK176 TaxID=2587071 RepID=UPI0021696D1F|nr:xanthine dehydrogenase family protein molybdopterin-binding subunit [Rhizobium sp. BK176]MCS4096465.1 xanthine dehydrogenase YagR molybdenum-binding subunit [Rhizobium sp. BK176]
MIEVENAAADIVGRANVPATGIGAPRPRPDGHAKVTGAAKFAGEEYPRGTLYGAMVTAAIASGSVDVIDASLALALPGVVRVLTDKDMPKLQAAPSPPAAQSFTPMQGTEIFYEGQPIGLVLAETLEAAEEGASLVKVAYKSRKPVVFETGTATTPRSGADGNGYAFAELDVEKGEAKEVFSASTKKVDQTYVAPTRHHNMMEPSTTLAEWRGDQLLIHDATQWTFGVRYALAALLEMSPDRIDVRCPFTGGGFGAKGYVWPHQILAPIAARIAKRPVKLSLGRTGCYTGTGYQSVVRSSLRLGADVDGRLQAVVHETENVSSINDDYVEFGSAGTRALYAIPALHCTTRIIKGNVGTPTAMRAPHEGPGMFATESAMDELAYACGIDPLELRLRNYAEHDPLTGKPFSSKALHEVYAEGARRFGWDGRPMAARSLTDGRKRIGWGMASAVMSTFRFASSARIRLVASGEAVIEAGCHEIGNGVTAIISQIAAEALGLPEERIRVRLGDTSLPETGGTFGSSTTISAGSAVADAAQKLLQRIAVIAGGVPPSSDDWPELLAKVGISELMAEGAFALPGEVPFDAHGGQSEWSMHTWGAVFVEMEVDEELGLARMRRCVAGYSAGRILNPRTARSQMIGGIIWGYGRAMLEESAVDARYGRYVSKNLSGVMLPVSADIPRNIDVFFVDENDPHASRIGARGIGELGEVGVAAAITNAIFHATGKRIRTLPVRIADIL